MWTFSRPVPVMIDAADALPGRAEPLVVEDVHFLSGDSISLVPEGHSVAYFGMGCFWGAERRFWQQRGTFWELRPGIYSTSVGYAGGYTPNPTYKEVCSGQTGHTEAVRVVFDPEVIAFDELLRIFWEGHDPTQVMRQGNDVGTQYRTWIGTTTDEQQARATRSKAAYEARLREEGRGSIATEIEAAGAWYFAETYHQAYLAKNPGGYCGLGGTGVSCPVGLWE